MSRNTVKFAINHMIAPRFTAKELIQAARELGVSAIELRNDVGENSLTDLQEAKEIGATAKEYGIRILTINALYPFNRWNDERAEQAENLAKLADACGAEALVMCPYNEGGYDVSPEQKKADLKEALQGLDKILGKYNLKGYVEALGFPICSMRFKKMAVDAIKELGLESRFGLVHDTFHHKGASESEYFADMTGLVHISGVEDTSVTFETMLDAHRILVGPEDRLDNAGQIRQLLKEGYDGYFAFEPFSEPVWNLEDPVSAVRESMDYIRSQL